MFQNYSQTYASAITALVGVVIVVLGLFKIQVVAGDVELVIGVLVNLIGIIWTLVHRAKQGDVTVLGFRK